MALPATESAPSIDAQIQDTHDGKPSNNLNIRGGKGNSPRDFPTTAHVFLEALHEVSIAYTITLLMTLADFQQAGVDYIFAVLGSDHPSIIEAYQGWVDSGKTRPKMLIFHHEVCSPAS